VEQPTPVPRIGRLARHLRLEDVALFVWLVLRPALVPEQSSAQPFAEGFDPLGGLFDLVALCGGAVALTARRADRASSGIVDRGDVGWAVGPLVAGTLLVLADVEARFGLGDSAGPLPIVIAVVVAIVARLWLPPTTAPTRRLLVAPFLLATSGIFSAILASLTDLFDLGTLAAATGTADLGTTLLVLGFGVAGIAIFYTMLIFAPRQIAEREGTGLTWTIRFLVFVAGLVLGTTLAGIVHGSIGGIST
jgi:hypothetical protein